MFGENLTTEGLLDGDVAVGDRFRVGTAELVVTHLVPRRRLPDVAAHESSPGPT